MRSQLSGLAAVNEPVSVHTFGFGADHDAKLLQAVAEAGHGIYYFIQASQFVGFEYVKSTFVLCQFTRPYLHACSSSSGCCRLW
jgi:hypothetical protein